MPALKLRRAVATCATALLLSGWASSAHGDTALKLLPLKRVRLYEVGVGYFERGGVLSDKSDLGLSLPQSQLDDALASLVIIGGAGQARVADIEFESRESPDLARSAAALTQDPGAPLDFASVLGSFRGAAVEVRQRGASLTGRLIDVIPLARANAEHCQQASARSKPADDASPASALCVEERDANLVVLNANGTLSRVALSQVESVRALDHAIAARLTRALNAVSQRSAAQGRRILHVHGSGSAALILGYVAEAPVWRPSYRLLLENADKSGTIQGFALIHNDTDEVWRGVNLELVNGRPRSFLYPLAAPRYARRELVTPEASLSTVPQLLTRSADDRWDPNVDGDASGDQLGESFGVAGIGEGGGGSGEGIGLGSVSVVGHGSGTSASPVLDVGNLTALNAAARRRRCCAVSIQGRCRDRPRCSRFGPCPVRLRKSEADACHLVRRRARRQRADGRATGQHLPTNAARGRGLDLFRGRLFRIFVATTNEAWRDASAPLRLGPRRGVAERAARGTQPPKALLVRRRSPD